MRYNNGKPVDRRRRLYYPYCGYKEGFCLRGEPCPYIYPDGNGCKYFRRDHPITKSKPQSLWMSQC